MHRIIYVILSLAMCATLLGCLAAEDQTGKVIDETFFKDPPPQGTEDRPGWIICVIKKGKPLYQRAFGMADVEKNIPITSQNGFVNLHYGFAALQNGFVNLLCRFSAGAITKQIAFAAK